MAPKSPVFLFQHQVNNRGLLRWIYRGFSLEFRTILKLKFLEHSTVTVWQKEGEKEAYRNMLERFPTGIVSVVSDSYDIYNACRYVMISN